jgi:nucleoside-diphosphate-sugar epimerase
MKLALTGGSGIVGSGILDMAVARGDEVVVLDRVPSPAPLDRRDNRRL